jgi:hypothetical protein
MIRPDSELHLIDVAQWSREEALHHLEVTFDMALLQHPDLIEPYLIGLAGAADEPEQPGARNQTYRKGNRAAVFFNARDAQQSQLWQAGDMA